MRVLPARRDLAANIPATATNVSVYIAAQFLGAFLGGVAVWLAYKKHFDAEAPAAEGVAENAGA